MNISKGVDKKEIDGMEVYVPYMMLDNMKTYFSREDNLVYFYTEKDAYDHIEEI